MHRRRTAAGLAAGVLAITGFSVVTAASADATPGSCSITYPTSYKASGKCTSGTGHYQLRVTCTDPLRGSGGYYYGLKVTIGQTSSVTCPYQGGVQWLASNATLLFSA